MAESSVEFCGRDLRFSDGLGGLLGRGMLLESAEDSVETDSGWLLSLLARGGDELDVEEEGEVDPPRLLVCNELGCFAVEGSGLLLVTRLKGEGEVFLPLLEKRGANLLLVGFSVG